MIKNILPTHLRRKVSPYPSTAVVIGTVIYNFNSYIINSRISKNNIGIKCSVKWNVNKYGYRKENFIMKNIIFADVNIVLAQ